MELKINELRLGNWIDSYIGYSCPINGFGQPSIGYRQVDIKLLTFLSEHPMATYRPIPLDAELLVRCGFQKTYFGNFYRIDNGKFSPWLEWKKDCFKVVVGDPEYFIGEVKCLHQLQNLYFALTGEELNYQP